MATEVGAGPSADDIHSVANSAWLNRLRNEIGTEPFLDDGAVVIQVTSGSGPILEGAPPDRTIKLPALGVHQARVTVTVGGSTLQRVVIDAHEQLEELTLDSSGRIDELIVNAGQDRRNLMITGQADVRTLRVRGGKFFVSPVLVRPTTVLDICGAYVEAPGGQSMEPAQLRLAGHVQLRGPLMAQSSQGEGGLPHLWEAARKPGHGLPLRSWLLADGLAADQRPVGCQRHPANSYGLGVAGAPLI